MQLSNSWNPRNLSLLTATTFTCPISDLSSPNISNGSKLSLIAGRGRPPDECRNLLPISCLCSVLNTWSMDEHYVVGSFCHTKLQHHIFNSNFGVRKKGKNICVNPIKVYVINMGTGNLHAKILIHPCLWLYCPNFLVKKTINMKIIIA